MGPVLVGPAKGQSAIDKMEEAFGRGMSVWQSQSCVCEPLRIACSYRGASFVEGRLDVGVGEAFFCFFEGGS